LFTARTARINSRELTNLLSLAADAERDLRRSQQARL
jgi:hypothetical protein